MPYDPARHHRRSIRLQSWNYAANGAYFVTVVAHGRAALFGDVIDGAMRLNAMGEIAQSCWQDIPEHFDHVEIDTYVIMPNHVHGIVMILDDVSTDVGAQHCCAPATDEIRNQRAINVTAGSLGAIVRSYKSVVTKRINQLRGMPAEPVWQRNYHERIIRNERELNAVRDYITKNPARWAEDVENARRPVGIWRALIQ
jgi:REP element-mobilizing transposase RayT